MSLVTAADQVSGSLFVVIRQRHSLNVEIERAAQIVGDPLADAGREVFFCVGANRVQRAMAQHRHAGEIQDGEFVGARQR